MIGRKLGLNLQLAMFLVVVAHLAGMFALKAWRGQERIAEAREQVERITQRLSQEAQLHAIRQVAAATLHQAEAVHPHATADEAFRKLQETLAIALPEARVEATIEATTPTKSLPTSVGLTILPVSIRLLVTDTTVLESIRSIEDIRPNVNVTRVHVRPADHRRRGPSPSPSPSTPLAEITIQSALLIKGAAQ